MCLLQGRERGDNMTELKTLKDFETLNDLLKIGEGSFRTDKYINIDELKAEAVKWIKELNRLDDEFQEKAFFLEKFSRPMSLKIYWIKHFFNITEEDLK